jgi:transcription-repair coupling factor (superfamily II helicase)
VYVASDLDTARRAADDLAFFTSNAAGLEPMPEATLFLTPAETSPYADIHPERQSAMLRLATLFTLGNGAPFGFWSSWRRRSSAACVVRARRAPRAEPTWLVAEDAVDLEAPVQRLSASGYFAIAGGRRPGRICRARRSARCLAARSTRRCAPSCTATSSFLREFDPESQRTTILFRRGVVPASEAILTPEVVERARTVVRALADAVNLPSSKARRSPDDVAEGAIPRRRSYLPPTSTVVAFEYPPDDAPLFVVRIRRPSSALMATSSKTPRKEPQRVRPSRIFRSRPCSCERKTWRESWSAGRPSRCTESAWREATRRDSGRSRLHRPMP